MGNQAAAELLQEVCASMYVCNLYYAVSKCNTLCGIHVYLSINASLYYHYPSSIQGYLLEALVLLHVLLKLLKKILKGSNK